MLLIKNHFLKIIFSLFEKWLNNENRPDNGSLVKLETVNGNTKTISIV
jgi:hypothetical protein